MVQLSFDSMDVEQLPPGVVGRVNGKVSSAYRKLVQESAPDLSRHLLFESARLSEASFNAETGEAAITIITAGFNTSKSHFYPAEVLKRDFAVFEGLKMFEDHQTDRENFERPEGSVRNWVANVKNVTAEQNGTIRATAVIIDDQFRAKLRLLAEKKLLDEMGVSIRAVAQGHEDKVEGIPVLIIGELLRGRSVDFVTEPGAGGQVNTFESDSDIDVDLIPAGEILARRPDIVAVCESNQEGQHKMELEEKVKELEQEKQKLQEDLDARVAKAEEAEKEHREAEVKALEEKKKAIEEKEKQARIVEAQGEITKLINESKLPEPAKKRLTERFKDAENKDGVEEAIKAETDYLAEVAPNRVSGMGSNGEPKVDLEESFKRMGLTEEEAKIAAAGRI